MRPALALLCALALPAGCNGDDPTGASAAAGGSGGAGASAEGGGGAASTGGGSGGAPGCLDHPDCTRADAAKCDGGSCVPCDDSAQCAGVTGAAVCEAGTCVACSLADESACSGGTTCDLLAMTCSGPAQGAVANCNACSNDLQCAAGHRCIALEFQSTPHGYYCLKEAVPNCNVPGQPFQVPINKPSISGAAAVNYCGIEEDLATCEAVLALLQNWQCPSDTDGMCSPNGVLPEVPVPGALCEQVGLATNRCTYACAGPGECPTPAAQSTCGTGTNMPPGWCGG